MICYTTNNDVCLYDIKQSGSVEVLVVGFIPYPGYWNFSISSQEYDSEEKLMELLADCCENEEWNIRGCSLTCLYRNLIKEVKAVWELDGPSYDAVANVINSLIGREIVLPTRFGKNMKAQVFCVNGTTVCAIDANKNEYEFDIEEDGFVVVI